MAGLDLPYSGSVATDIDVFAITNNLGVGQSDNDTSRVASVVGHGGICHGIHGDNGNGSGTTPQYGVGVWGESDNGFGVYGASGDNSGVQGVSAGYDGVHGESNSPAHAGVSGTNNNGGIGVWGSSAGKAGQFEGNVLITGTLQVDTDIIMPASDFAEEFDIRTADDSPGTVMVLDDDGALQASRHAYDKRVAGVISGAGGLGPGITLDKRNSATPRMPVALIGKVYCKVDATYAAIAIGDLLTTSPTPGHAMKATDHSAAFGSVIGKAMRCLSHGSGMIPILVALQ